MHLVSENFLVTQREKALLSLVVGFRLASSSCGVWKEMMAHEIRIVPHQNFMCHFFNVSEGPSACIRTSRRQWGPVHPIVCIFGGQHDSISVVSDAFY